MLRAGTRFRVWRSPLHECRNSVRNGDPGQLRLDPDMSVDDEPIRFIQGSCGNASHPRSDLRGMGDSGSAIRAEVHPQPAPAFIRTMLALCQLPLNELHRVFVEGCNDSERACQSSLTELAMAHSAEGGLSINTVTNCAASTASCVTFNHFWLQYLEGWVSDGLSWRLMLGEYLPTASHALSSRPAGVDNYPHAVNHCAHIGCPHFYPATCA